MGMEALKGKRLVIAGSRKTEEMSAIIEKQGGTALVRSLQGLTLLDEETLEAPLRRFAAEGADWVVLTTGIGSETLASNAEKLDIKEAFLEQLTQASIASRGYKTTAYLKRTGLKAVVADDDGTVQNLIEKLAEHDFAGQRIVIQLHGEPSPELERFFAAKKAGEVISLLPYKHVPPEVSVLTQLMEELAAGEVDAICFTTAVQVQYLFRYARKIGLEQQLLELFAGQVLAAAVGKVTAEALQLNGVQRYIVPDIERMGAMIIEVAHYYEAQGLTQ
ncbi:uroporphyrinogen-III synthase [Paenibacillus sp. Leaf72]|nr:uroporphyrinogen-III synthase [Paenibacillus sp. Leaf72]KQO17830.1 uroporphyrinogen-III synthase [Paenibacillus sp. Leaf72]